ncbi:MAG: ABC-F family ATPase [Flavobacteriaceae bacterium]|nr:ABC-F family ATPase [Flavobacteriaceae bacterium]|tara:strand:- start:13 stop:1635 length:1623 start_codon:yes stop_codon:yes gene_type:complete
MLSVSNLSLQFGKRTLFDQVNIIFSPGNCYGIIGANGAGKSTFLKILSGKLVANSGTVDLEPGKRISFLEQDHNSHDNFSVMETVIRGNNSLFKIKQEMEEIYSNENFSDQDGERLGELQIKFEEINGWNAETDAATLLSNLGINESFHNTIMSNMTGKQKVKVLLAQSLFGNPDVLIMDEPTNDLDYEAIVWLENFLAEYENIVIIVSHDRYFLDNVCTHISDIDFGKISHFSGNYSFWSESSKLVAKQKIQQNKKAEDKKKELEEFISRFSANVAKSKQATSRKKMIDKLNIEDIKPSSRRYPAIIFEQEREAGDQILNVDNLSYTKDSETLFNKISFNLIKGDKVVLYSKNSRATTALYEILSKNINPNSGIFEWGITTSFGYLPMDNSDFFNDDLDLIQWLRQWTNGNDEIDDLYLRGFLGKMLFSGDEALKKATVLSGGEKVRCMLSKIMMNKSNVLILDEPTNHLDLESITSFNNALKNYKGTVLLSTKDREFAQTVANRIIEIGPNGMIDKYLTLNDYMTDSDIKNSRIKLYN